MHKNEAYILEVIQQRKERQDPVQQFAVRNKASPLNFWHKFEPYSEEAFRKIYKGNVDGVKLKFKTVTVLINGRHRTF